jgi:hypothetical protein
VDAAPEALSCPSCGGIWWECGGFVADGAPDSARVGLGAFQIDAEGNPLVRSGTWLCIACGAELGPAAGTPTSTSELRAQARAAAGGEQGHPAGRGRGGLRVLQGGGNAP